MDLVTIWEVARRQSRVIFGGVAVSIALAIFLLLDVRDGGVQLRSPKVYEATSTVFVTQPGFPWGRSAITEYVEARGGGRDTPPVPRFADPGRMEYLASLYSELALSAAIGPPRIRGERVDPTAYDARQVTSRDGRNLPLIEITGTSDSPAEAIAIANAVTQALREYVSTNQAASGIAEEERVNLPVVDSATEAEVIQGIRLTGPAMLFLAGLTLTLLLAFALDNVKRRPAAAGAKSTEQPLDVAPEADIREAPAMLERKTAEASGRAGRGTRRHRPR